MVRARAGGDATVTAQAVLPGIRADVPAANRAMVESDLRGDTTLAILAYLAWSDAHCDARKMLDGSIAAWLTSGRPDDPQISRSLVKLRSQLARHVDRGCHVPEWFPKSLLAALGTPWCAAELEPSQSNSETETETPRKKAPHDPSSIRSRHH